MSFVCGEPVFARLSSEEPELFDQSSLLVSFFAKPKPEEPDEDFAEVSRVYPRTILGAIVHFFIHLRSA